MEEHMIFRQILHPATSCASYIFGYTGKNALPVVDPHAAHLARDLPAGDVGAASEAGENRVEMDSAAGAAARPLYGSLQRLLERPDDLEIYPARFAGSACGRAMSGKPSSTLGFERRFNPALRQRSPDEFIAFILDDLPAPPAGHLSLRAANHPREPRPQLA